MQITPEIEELIDRALAEDLALGDPTTDSLIPEGLAGAAGIISRQDGVVAGGSVLAAVFRRIDPWVRVAVGKPDGSTVRGGDEIARVEGPLASMLKAERTALNFVQRLSGIATTTSTYVKAVEGLPVRIVDTRKTTPGLRTLEKAAVRAGGGSNHRMALADGVLIKDNHIDALRKRGMSLRDIVERARSGSPHTLKIEVEVEGLDGVREALDAGADILMLDNMPLEDMARAVQMAKGRAITEASGGISLDTVRAVGSTRVDLISVGALTHSSSALDIGLDLL